METPVERPGVDGPQGPLDGRGWPHRSRKLPERPPNWDALSPEAKARWEAFRDWYRDQLEDEKRDALRRKHGY